MICFRVDASVQIGTGHVMRCLTLAEQLTAGGLACRFISRDLPGNLLGRIRERGFDAAVLPAPSTSDAGGAGNHRAWLGVDWRADAAQTADVLARSGASLLVVDHYGLDREWEDSARDGIGVFVIDDLANRAHACELLLDQNAGRSVAHYAALVPAGCKVLAGPDHALLRPEFAAGRARSLERRESGELAALLVTMGGVDSANATGLALDALAHSLLPRSSRITVVMGSGAPALAQVRERASRMPWPTDVRVDIDDMALQMAASDLAVGAAGVAALERCSLGLPTLQVVLADNQRPGAEALAAAGAAFPLGEPADIAATLPRAIEAWRGSDALRRAGRAAAGLVDGLGTSRVANAIRATYAL
jgi:UDP-2,4-diacetamido-2,4,6-trideoxy-beta-L-altropyranose hydrolase